MDTLLLPMRVSFRRILGRRGPFLADTLPLLSFQLPWQMLCHRGRRVLSLADALPPLLLEACLIAFAVPLLYRLPRCCCLYVIGSVC